MTDRLNALEADGFKFCMKGAMLSVNAPKTLLNPQAVEQLKSWRDDLIMELLTRSFCSEVRRFSLIKHDIDLSDNAIKFELDEIDLACLRDTPLTERTVWAELLAYRLSNEALEAINQ